MVVGLEKRWTKRSIDGGPSWRVDVYPTVLEASSEIETFPLESLRANNSKSLQEVPESDQIH